MCLIALIDHTITGNICSILCSLKAMKTILHKLHHCHTATETGSRFEHVHMHCRTYGLQPSQCSKSILIDPLRKCLIAYNTQHIILGALAHEIQSCFSAHRVHINTLRAFISLEFWSKPIICRQKISRVLTCSETKILCGKVRSTGSARSLQLRQNWLL